jgi:tetratricopeptide (TPR) repeat protein
MRGVRCPLALFLFCSMAVGQTTSIDRGIDLFRQQHYEAALEQFLSAKQSQPANAAIDNLIGITETRLGRIDEANAAYEAASRLQPSLAGPHTNLGFNYLGKKQYDLAETQLQTALALDPNDPSVHYYLVILYLSTAREQKGVPHIKPAESLLANDTAGALLAIEACVNVNAFPKAADLLNKLDERSALSIQQENTLAQVLQHKQMYREAAVRLRRIAQLQPSSWEARYNLAVALVKAQQVPEALPVLQSLVSEHASDATVLAAVASAFETAGQNSLARETFLKAIAADPGNADRYLDGSRLFIDLNQYDNALALVQQGIPLVPDNYPLTIRLGAIEMMKGEHEKAREAYHTAIAEHPAVALGYVALAQSYMKQGKDEDALKVLTEGRTLTPRDFALEYVFGLVSAELGHQEQALAAFTNAETLDPSIVEPHYQIGLLNMQKQQWQAAQTEFEQVLKLDPHNGATYYQLSRTYQRLGDTAKAQQMAKQAAALKQTERDEATKEQQLRFGVPSRD